MPTNKGDIFSMFPRTVSIPKAPDVVPMEKDKPALEAFTGTIPREETITKALYIDYFVYYLTKNNDSASASPYQINACFSTLDLQAHSNVYSYLSTRSKKRGKSKPHFVKSAKGYRLERAYRDYIESTLGKQKPAVKAMVDLRKLLPKIKTKNEYSYLSEAIKCLENDAPRGAIVLTWILTVDHLIEYILKYNLVSFNAVLGKNTDKRIKVTVITARDDFSDIPENKLIEFARSAGIISNDVRKILDTKLGIRNSAGHPSTVIISETKAAEFVEDLILNVINKYHL